MTRLDNKKEIETTEDHAKSVLQHYLSIQGINARILETYYSWKRK